MSGSSEVRDYLRANGAAIAHADPGRKTVLLNPCNDRAKHMAPATPVDSTHSCPICAVQRRGGRAVECTGLENHKCP
ncbi:MAG: hypothetical protein VX054_02815 [Pseudomonadota bacterium]|nr:hypothetical protein [Pseudomonadota bacterium]